MTSYVFSEHAELDLKDIYRYGFANYGENRAEIYKEFLKEKCQFLSENPNICYERYEFNLPIRIYHHKKHLIVYLIKVKHILIVRILHENMNIEKLLAT